MLGKLPTEHQQTMWAPPLEMMLNPDHQLVKLAKRLPWDKLEAEFGSLYAPVDPDPRHGVAASAAADV